MGHGWAPVEVLRVTIGPGLYRGAISPALACRGVGKSTARWAL